MIDILIYKISFKIHETQISYAKDSKSHDINVPNILEKVLTKTEYWSIFSCIWKSDVEFQIPIAQNFEFLRNFNLDFYKIIIEISIKLVPIISNNEQIIYITSILMALIFYIEKIQSKGKIDSSNFLRELHDFSLIWDVILKNNQFKFAAPIISVSECETTSQDEMPKFYPESLNRYVQKFLVILNNLLIKKENQINNPLRIRSQSKKIRRTIKYTHDEISSQEESD